MLVSAAMAERPRAAASGRQIPRLPRRRLPAGARRSIRRRAWPRPRAPRSELPGWFWRALGCLTVLVVGLTVVFRVSAERAPSRPATRAAAAPLAGRGHDHRRAEPGAAAARCGGPRARPRRASGSSGWRRRRPRSIRSPRRPGREAQGSRPSGQGRSYARGRAGPSRPPRRSRRPPKARARQNEEELLKPKQRLSGRDRRGRRKRREVARPPASAALRGFSRPPWGDDTLPPAARSSAAIRRAVSSSSVASSASTASPATMAPRATAGACRARSAAGRARSATQRPPRPDRPRASSTTDTAAASKPGDAARHQLLHVAVAEWRGARACLEQHRGARGAPRLRVGCQRITLLRAPGGRGR